MYRRMYMYRRMCMYRRILVEFFKSSGNKILDRLLIKGKIYERDKIWNDFKKSAAVIKGKEKGAEKCDQYQTIS